MAELFDPAQVGTPDHANDRVPYFDASETLVNQIKNCSPRTLVNSGLELQANGDSTSAIVRHTSLGYITGHIPIASPDTLANSLPAGSITGTPVITPGASLLVQFVIASAIGANGYNVYKRRCGKSGATNWRGVEGWELVKVTLAETSITYCGLLLSVNTTLFHAPLCSIVSRVGLYEILSSKSPAISYLIPNSSSKLTALSTMIAASAFSGIAGIVLFPLYLC